MYALPRCSGKNRLGSGSGMKLGLFYVCEKSFKTKFLGNNRDGHHNGEERLAQLNKTWIPQLSEFLWVFSYS